jgi:predicted RNase H-like HicB family nuclease
MELTAAYKKVPEGYIARVEDLPGANTQGATLDEARENLRQAIRMVLPRLTEINDILAHKICQDLRIPDPP